MFGLSKTKEAAPKLDEVAIIIGRLERIVSGKDTRLDWKISRFSVMTSEPKHCGFYFIRFTMPFLAKANLRFCRLCLRL